MVDRHYRSLTRLCPIRARTQGGFTLVELMVVIVIIGTLAAVALPSFLKQAARSKQARALSYVGTVNRAQQAFFMENARFANSTAELGIGENYAPDDYVYTVNSQNQGLDLTSTQAIPINPALRGYAGVVFTTVDPGGMARMSAVICQGTTDTAPSPTPVTVGNEVQITNCNNL